MAAAVRSCASSRLTAPRLPLAQQRSQPPLCSIPAPVAHGTFHGRDHWQADCTAPCSSRGAEKLRGHFLGGKASFLAQPQEALQGRRRAGVHCSAEPVAGSTAVAELPGSRIWMSDVVARPKRNYFVDRKWTSKDLIYGGFMLFMHGACLLAPFTFSWDAFGVFALLYFITGCLGITLSFHRNLSHKSFKVPKPLEYLFAYCGIQAVQGDPIEWVSSHRYHHVHCDTENDPHTPKEGFWHSHMGWLLDDEATQTRVGKRTNVSDMENDPFYKFIQKTYPLHPLAAAVALYAWGGLPYVVWGMAVRVVWVYHITWFVNSASHVWGSQSWNTGDLSRNNWWVALLAFGEGWHNNHHAFEYSARHGLDWWQFDPTWYIIAALEKVGLATKVKLPRPDHMARLAPTQAT